MIQNPWDRGRSWYEEHYRGYNVDREVGTGSVWEPKGYVSLKVFRTRSHAACHRIVFRE